MPRKSNNFLPWHEVEKQIFKEINWLRETIEIPFEKEEENINSITYCKECLLRKIAILIVSGEIKVKEIKKRPLLESFWLNKPLINKKKIRHGQDWHSSTMEKIENHFLIQEYDVEREPNLFWGRADLGVFKKNEPNLYIEVGTISSLFKLLVNLISMKHLILLIVLNDEKLIEFRKN